jgi:hypothetical protein
MRLKKNATKNVKVQSVNIEHFLVKLFEKIFMTLNATLPNLHVDDS